MCLYYPTELRVWYKKMNTFSEGSVTKKLQKTAKNTNLQH